MAQKRREESEFKVSDRRLFTSEGELRGDSAEEPAPPPAVAAAPSPAPTAPPEASGPVLTVPGDVAAPLGSAVESDVPEPPSDS
jgi:hypothetical protein